MQTRISYEQLSVIIQWHSFYLPLILWCNIIVFFPPDFDFLSYNTKAFATLFFLCDVVWRLISRSQFENIILQYEFQRAY